MGTDRTRVRRAPQKQVFEPEVARKILERAILALWGARVIPEEEKRPALQALSDHLFPEHRAELRKSTEQEIKATAVLAFPLTEVSVKISNGQPDDPESDIPDYIQRWPQNRT